jgi:hypothetical protein
MKGPRTYKAINAIMSELARAGIAKTHTNAQEQFHYRSIDDVLNRMAPLFARHRLCVLPRVLERVAVDRNGANNELLVSVALKVAFDLISAVDESLHTVESYGEALDSGDKATSKAMSSAYKAAMLQAFCIPVAGNEDADAHTHKLRKSDHEPQPAQGWEQWSRDIADIIGVCESEEALTRVQDTNRALLKAISRERSEFYQTIGDAFSRRRAALVAPGRPANTKAPAKKPNRTRPPDLTG